MIENVPVSWQAWKQSRQDVKGGSGTVELMIEDGGRTGKCRWCRCVILHITVETDFPIILHHRLNGSSWIDNITNGIVSWRAVTLVELRNRSDTNQANASPETTILPAVRWAYTMFSHYRTALWEQLDELVWNCTWVCEQWWELFCLYTTNAEKIFHYILYKLLPLKIMSLLRSVTIKYIYLMCGLVCVILCIVFPFLEILLVF